MTLMNPCHPSDLHNVATRKTKPRTRILGVPLKRVREDQIVVTIDHLGDRRVWVCNGVIGGLAPFRLPYKSTAAMHAVWVLTRYGVDPDRITIKGGRGIRSSGAYWHRRLMADDGEGSWADELARISQEPRL